jgi:hypothetical protein
MELETLKVLVSRIHGCTFATIDTETYPVKGLRKVSRGERVIIFRTNGASGYEGMLKRRLEEAGLNADSFHVGPLPWGTRVEDLPIIENKGNYYLQTIEIAPGEDIYYFGATDQVINDPSAFGVRRRPNTHQDLPSDRQVKISVYRIDNIKRIAIFGEEILDTSVATRKERAILKLNYDKKS